MIQARYRYHRYHRSAYGIRATIGVLGTMNPVLRVNPYSGSDYLVGPVVAVVVVALIRGPL